MRRATIVLVVVAIMAAGACSEDKGARGSRERRATFRLASALQPFSACEELQQYLRTEGARLVGPYGLTGPAHKVVPTPLMAEDDSSAVAGNARESQAAAPGDSGGGTGAGVDYSTTNVQEEGVDEPDIVKTDGRRLLAVAGGRLRIVDLTGEAPTVSATLPVGQQYTEPQLLLAGDRLLVLDAAEPVAVPDRPTSQPGGGQGVASDVIAPEPGQVRVTVVDIADIRTPRVVSEVRLDGSLVSARMVDGVARLVLRSSGSPRLRFTGPQRGDEDGRAAAEANRRVVAESTVDDWLPRYAYSEPGRPEASATGPLADCRDVARPREFSGLDMVSVVTVDAADPRPGPAATVLGAGELVYASASSLYVTTTRWAGPIPLEDGPATGRDLRDAPGSDSTEIHKFDIKDKVRTTYLASGGVPGRLLNQFSMSELSGDLRVATTTEGSDRTGGGPRESESRVVVLRQDGQTLATVGSVGGLGKGERIFAVRFVGDRGYVVTFRQTDPLYVVDLADPRHPAVRGELKIPGYSAYLHPVGDHRLLGVGQEATEEGRTLGTQLSLFDVSDPASPRRVAHRVLDRSSSQAEFDHHAFLYWARTGMALLPVESFGDVGIMEDGRGGVASPEPRQGFVGAIGFSVGDGGVDEIGRISHRGGTAIRRSVVAGDRVMTLSEAGLLTSDLRTLAERAWLNF